MKQTTMSSTSSSPSSDLLRTFFVKHGISVVDTSSNIIRDNARSHHSSSLSRQEQHQHKKPSSPCMSPSSSSSSQSSSSSRWDASYCSPYSYASFSKTIMPPLLSSSPQKSTSQRQNYSTKAKDSSTLPCQRPQRSASPEGIRPPIFGAYDTAMKLTTTTMKKIHASRSTTNHPNTSAKLYNMIFESHQYHHDESLEDIFNDNESNVTSVTTTTSTPSSRTLSQQVDLLVKYVDEAERVLLVARSSSSLSSTKANKKTAHQQEVDVKR